MKSKVVTCGRKHSRLGALTLITLMVLLFTTGVSTAADDEFKLFQLSDVTGKYEPLGHLTDAEIANGVKLIYTEVQPDSFSKVVSDYSDPFKLAELFRAAKLKADEAGPEESAKFDKSVRESLDAIKAAKYGGAARKEGIEILADKVLSLTKEDLKNLRRDDFLKKVFTLSLREKLALKDAVPEKGESLADVIKDEMKKLADLLAKNQPQPQPTPETPGKQDPSPANPSVPAQPVQPATPVASTQRNPGELSDEQLRKMIQPVCDQFNALTRGFTDSVSTAVNPVRDALNQLFNQVEGISRLGNAQVANNNRNNRGLEDVLAAAIADTQRDNRNNQIIPPQQPILPQQRLAANNTPNPASDIPLPPPAQPQDNTPPPSNFPAYIPQNNYNNSPYMNRPINIPLPNLSGSSVRRAAQAVLNEDRESVVQDLSQSTPVETLFQRRGQVRNELRRVQNALRDVKSKAADMDDKLSTLQDGARKRLPQSVKMQEMQYKNDLDNAKKNMDNTRQMMMMSAQNAQNNPDAYAQLQQNYQTQQQEVQQLEQKYNNYEQQIESTVEEKDSELQTAAKERDRLNTLAGKLESQVGSIKEDDQTIGQYIDMQKQAMIQAMIGPQGGGNGTRTVDKIMNGNYGNNGGGRGNGPRSPRVPQGVTGRPGLGASM